MNLIIKLFKIVSKDKLFAFFFFIILMFFMMFLEMFGISLIIPLISLITDKNFQDSDNLFVNIFENFNFINQDILIVTAIFLICFFILKFFCSIFFIYFQERYMANIKKDLQYHIFKRLLLKPFEFHLYKNSSEFIALNTKEVDIMSELIASLALIISEIFITIGILSLLIYIAPYPTLIISFFILSIGISINLFSKDKILTLGKERVIQYAYFVKIIQQGLLGIKDIKIANKENYFINKIIEPTSKLAQNGIIISILQSLPRLILELVFILSILTLVLFLSNNLENILPTLALFTGAGFRLMPSANRIISNLQSVVYAFPSISKIYTSIQDDSYLNENKIDNAKFAFNNSIKVENLSFHYNNLKDIFKTTNLTIHKNEFIGIIGKSGSGKSTFVNLIIGLLGPTSGIISIDDKDIKLMPKIWMRNIGYVPQEVFLLDESLKNNIALGIEDNKIDLKKLNEVISECDLNHFVFNLSDGVDTIIGERGLRISGGERQRIGIARALYTNPSILIFDESTSSLDYKTEKEIIDSLSRFKNKRTIIFISHRKEALKNCTKIYELKNFGLHLL